MGIKSHLPYFSEREFYGMLRKLELPKKEALKVVGCSALLKYIITIGPAAVAYLIYPPGSAAVAPFTYAIGEEFQTAIKDHNINRFIKWELKPEPLACEVPLEC